MLEGLAQGRFEALNRRDLAAIVAMWDDDAVFEFPGRTPMSGRFEGITAIAEWWRRWVDRYAAVQFTVKHVGIVGLRPGSPILLVAWDADGTMVDGVRAKLGAEVGVAITGIAGPSGGTAEKPVGTVVIAVRTPDRHVVKTFAFAGDRQTIRIRSVATALDLVRRLAG